MPHLKPRLFLAPLAVLAPADTFVRKARATDPEVALGANAASRVDATAGGSASAAPGAHGCRDPAEDSQPTTPARSIGLFGPSMNPGAR